MLAAKGALQFGIKLGDGNGGKETEAAEIHGKQGDLTVADGARGREQGSVAAQHDDQVAAFGDGGPRNAVGAAGLSRGALVEAYEHAARFEPGVPLRNDAGSRRDPT